jgi:hypothetical protein
VCVAEWRQSTRVEMTREREAVRAEAIKEGESSGERKSANEFGSDLLAEDGGNGGERRGCGQSGRFPSGFVESAAECAVEIAIKRRIKRQKVWLGRREAQKVGKVGTVGKANPLSLLSEAACSEGGMRQACEAKWGGRASHKSGDSAKALSRSR